MRSFSEGFPGPTKKHKSELWRPIPFQLESSGSLSSTLISSRYISEEAAQRVIAEMMPLRAEGAKGTLYGWVQSVTFSGGVTRADVLWQQGGAVPDAAGDLITIYVAPRGQYPNDWPRATQNWAYLAVNDNTQRTLATSSSVQEINSALRINIPCAGNWEIYGKVYVSTLMSGEYTTAGKVAISTATNSISNPETEMMSKIVVANGTTVGEGESQYPKMYIKTTGPQTLYIVGIGLEGTPDLRICHGGFSATMIYAKPQGI